MPWKTSGVMDERVRFAVEYESGEWTMAELCRHYGISRKTGYKIVARWQQRGAAGMEDRSRAPRSHPNQTAAEVEAAVLALRRAHMSWGPRKLRSWLQDHHPQRQWPAASTIGAMLSRAGMAHARRLRRRTPPFTQPFAAATQANDLWCADFKGWFRTRDGERIDPFTMTDAASRYLLRCQAVEKTDTAAVRSIMDAAFREYGLPLAIRTDNGAPFATRGIAGLSRLSLYWMKLGIVPERIRAGHPEENGRHERMHRTLAAETARPPEANRRRQQDSFDRFAITYNQQRPHEALGQKPPATFYTPSPRPHPGRIPEPEYDTGIEVRSVYPHGQFFWKGHHIFLGKALAGQRIGLEQLDDRYWCVCFASFPIAWFDSVDLTIGPLPPVDTSAGGNLEISKNRDSQIPTATTAAGQQAKLQNLNTDRNVLPICPV
jgi:transposase InsO family protein